MKMSLNLFEELVGLLADLEAAGAGYALAGGLAVAVHGVVRATEDIDLLVPEDQVSTIEALARARGFNLATDLLKGLCIRRLIRIAEKTLWCWTSWWSTSAMAYRDRQRLRLADTEIAVVSRAGLEAMKLTAGRDQDLADLRRLRELDA
jgi:hypothetical protein